MTIIAITTTDGVTLGADERTASAGPDAAWSDRGGVAPDTSDMVVVHRAFRREFRVIPELVRQVAAGEVHRAGVVGEHLRLCLHGLHLHHTSEDALLWPWLLERAAPSAALVHRMEDQHSTVEQAIAEMEPMVSRWVAEARPAVGGELADRLDAMYEALVAHLDAEERDILPLAERHLTQQEWASIGEAGVAKMTKRQLPLMFGMVMEDATAAERRQMLAVLPAPVRFLMRTWGARHYRRYVRLVRQAR